MDEVLLLVYTIDYQDDVPWALYYLAMLVLEKKQGVIK